ncbi:MAG: dihydrolipoyllysine-residue acetyltransferase [Zoogloeaceae bacterium]|jgi:pyruvate dehydrogenase E2 component (dihydrolipoamide acetyltransferase)|nr:dihydrolipoyllysine-residue acetyltransferase [Zoogloeaceae bacterium]
MPTLTDIKVPDIGDFSDVPVIDVFVRPGDTVIVDDTLVTLESDKATMDVPATIAGVIEEVLVKPGDKVSEGSLLVRVRETKDEGCREQQSISDVAPAVREIGREAERATPLPAVTTSPAAEPSSANLPHASPSIRAYARELGVDLRQIAPTGPKGRILREDVTAHVKDIMTSKGDTSAGSGPEGHLDLLPWPKVDFARFGAIDARPLSRIQKISGQNLARNWVMIPAVTYHEDADITDLEAFRVRLNKESGEGGARLTLLAFLIKACVRALQEFPVLNSSLDGDTLILKKYFHIGFAADTPNGLVVPVVKEADRKGIFEIAAETGELARQAREGKLKPVDMQGASFTVSSLGGIGGTSFSPIINAPEVAILGVNKSAMKPVWDGQSFQPRLILPLSLTADHRVIDGALATRFNVYLAQLLSDFRRVTL